MASFAEWCRECADPNRSEFTVVKVDAYNGINAYLSELSGTDIQTVQDVLAYNYQNQGTEGARTGIHPAFPSGLASTCLSKNGKPTYKFQGRPI